MAVYPMKIGKNLNNPSPIALKTAEVGESANPAPSANIKIALTPYNIPAADRGAKIGWKIAEIISTN